MGVRTGRRLPSIVLCTALGVALASTAGCGQRAPAAEQTRGVAVTAQPSPATDATPTTTTRAVAMAKPGKLTKPSLSPDVLISSTRTLPSATLAKIRGVKGVTNANTFSMGTFYNEERQVTYAAVDPATFRRYTPPGSAQTQEVWDRVAGGEMAITRKLGRQLQDKTGYVKMGNDDGSLRVHIGAYADLVSRFGGTSVIDAVVNEKWAGPLRMKVGNAMLVSTGETSPQSILKKLRVIAGPKTSVQILAVNLDIHATQTAVLTGGSVSDALGTLTYTANSNGSVNPDPRWVNSFIRTENVPILGKVTCNKLMLPELRGALTDVVRQGLSSKIYEYGGCFVPRFIAGSSSLSFHTYGTAIDLNVPDNGRGTVGKMDRQVVKIFEHWGFQWGGTWHYTDPMHFELHRFVRAS